ncbi:hypothetical protein CBL_20969 [Carabus blaptoides fortunei]
MKNQQSSTSVSKIPSNFKQQKLQGCIAVQWSLADPRSREIHFSIGEMIALDNQPISIVENAENIIPHLYSETKSEIRKNILIADAISVTTDIWTNTNNLESFLSFTAHWLDESFTFRHAVLQMKHFPEQHTAQNIKECLDNIPSLWDISHTKIHAVVRDNGRNMVKAIDDSSFSAVPCFIHTMQSKVQSTILLKQNVHAVRSQFFLEAPKNSVDEDSESEEGTESGGNSPNNVSLEDTVHKNFWACYNEITSKKVDGNEKSS